ncbi:hypothetical protein LguiA_030649 [Lonicera macranthoides]
MDKSVEVRVEHQYGSRFVEEEEYRNNRVVRIEVLLYVRDYSPAPAGGPTPFVVEKSYGRCKTFLVDRDQLLSSLPPMFTSQLFTSPVDDSVLLSNDEKSELVEKINACVQCMPEPMMVSDTRVAAELLVRIDIERWKTEN